MRLKWSRGSEDLVSIHDPDPERCPRGIVANPSVPARGRPAWLGSGQQVAIVRTTAEEHPGFAAAKGFARPAPAHASASLPFLRGGTPVRKRGSTIAGRHARHEAAPRRAAPTKREKQT